MEAQDSLWQPLCWEQPEAVEEEEEDAPPCKFLHMLREYYL